jgi:hypothetical protein
MGQISQTFTLNLFLPCFTHISFNNSINVTPFFYGCQLLKNKKSFMGQDFIQAET